MEPIYEQEVAVSGIQEMANGRVRLTVRNKLTDEEKAAAARQGAGATLGNQVFAFETDLDEADPYRPGESVTIAITRGGPGA